MCVSVGVWLGNNPQRVGGGGKKEEGNEEGPFIFSTA